MPGPALHLPLDAVADGKVADLSGNGHAGRIEGEATPIPDETFGACLAFAGNGKVEVPHAPGLQFSRDMTVEAWVYVAEHKGELLYVLGKGTGAGRNYVLWLTQRRTWMFQWNHYAGGHIVGAAPAGLKRWYHIAGTSRGGEATLYVHDREGRLLERLSQPFTAYCGQTAEPVTLGTGLVGRMAHARVHGKGLTQAEIERDIADDRRRGRRLRVAKLLEEAAPRSGLRFDATAAGGPGALVSTRPIERPNLANGFTLEAFVKSYDRGPPGSRPRRVVAAFGGAKGWILSLSQGVLTFRMAVTEVMTEGGLEPTRHAAERMVQESPESALGWTRSPPAWRHVAVRVSPSSARVAPEYALYVDGSPVGVFVGGLDEASAAPAEDTLYVGALPEGAAADRAAFHGEIAEVRLWDLALGRAVELELNAVRGLSGAEFGLTGHWPIDGAAGQPLRDTTPAGRHLRPTGPAPTWIPADSTEEALGPRLRLVDPAIAIDPRVQIQQLRTQVAHLRRERALVDASTGELQDTIDRVQTHREQLEEKVVEAERAANAEIARQAEALRQLKNTLKTQRDDFRTRLQQRQWSVAEVIAAVDQQLQEAREAVGAEGQYRLDQLSLDLKAVPTADGRELKFPDPTELRAMPPNALSTVRFDFESRERFEASQPKVDEVPDVVGLTEAMARRRLAAAGFLMEVAHGVVPVGPRAERLVGTVLEQAPTAGENLAVNGRVTVYIGLRARPR